MLNVSMVTHTLFHYNIVYALDYCRGWPAPQGARAPAARGAGQNEVLVCGAGRLRA